MSQQIVSKIILVVEDEPLLLLQLEDLLLDRGFGVLTARNADEAIDLLSAHSDVDLIMTDVNMPGSMNGLELLKVVRKRWPPVKMIVVSSQSIFKPGDVPDDVSIIRKPYMFDDLNAKAMQLLGL